MKLSRDYEMVNITTDGTVIVLSLNRKQKVSKTWYTKENTANHQGKISSHETIEEAMKGLEFIKNWTMTDEFYGDYECYANLLK